MTILPKKLYRSGTVSDDKADQLKSTEIISDADVGRATDLKERMESAQKILVEKWKPVQDDIAKLGMNYHESLGRHH